MPKPPTLEKRVIDGFTSKKFHARKLLRIAK